MKFLVLGCGSIGSRHISNIQKILPRSEIHVYDSNKELRQKICKKLNVLEEEKIPKNKSMYDLVLICTPPVSHISLAIDSIKDGANVFIEKPLSSNNNEISKLKKNIKKNKSLVFVGYNFRFNEGINLVKEFVVEKKLGKVLFASAYFGQYLPDWRPKQDYKKNYSFKRELGGGIIFDSSHEINYLCWILGNPINIQSNFVSGISLKTNVDGLAEIILKFRNNILANIHLDFIRSEYRRTVEFLCEKGIISWSLKENHVKIFDRKKKNWKKVKIFEDVNQMYIKEMNHVIDCVKQNKKSKIIDIENGIRTLNLSHLIKKSGETGKRIKI